VTRVRVISCPLEKGGASAPPLEFLHLDSQRGAVDNALSEGRGYGEAGVRGPVLHGRISLPVGHRDFTDLDQMPATP
jgi:hypothetical protein